MLIVTPKRMARSSVHGRRSGIVNGVRNIDSWPFGLLSLWNAKNQNGTVCLVGPQIQTSAAGNQPDADGNMVPWPVNHPGKGVMVQPAYTNKCTCRKKNPTDTTNISKSGDAAAVLSVVDDTAALAAAGLSSICTSGKVYKLDNSAGTTNANVEILGSTGNTNPHSASLFARKEGAGTSNLLWLASPYQTAPITQASYTSIAIQNQVAVNGLTWRLVSAAGAIVYFILPQLVESPYLMPFVAAVDDAAAAVSVTSTASTSGGNGLAIPLNAQMTAALSGGAFTAACLCWMGVGSGELPNSSYANILSVRNINTSDILYIRKNSGGGVTIVNSSDGTSVSAPVETFSRSNLVLFISQVNAARTHFISGYRRYTSAMVPIDAGVVWGALVVYDGSMGPLTHLRFGYGLTVPIGFIQVQMWSKSASDAEILNVLGYAL